MIRILVVLLFLLTLPLFPSPRSAQTLPTQPLYLMTDGRHCCCLPLFWNPLISPLWLLFISSQDYLGHFLPFTLLELNSETPPLTSFPFSFPPFQDEFPDFFFQPPGPLLLHFRSFLIFLRSRKPDFSFPPQFCLLSQVEPRIFQNILARLPHPPLSFPPPPPHHSSYSYLSFFMFSPFRIFFSASLLKTWNFLVGPP